MIFQSNVECVILYYVALILLCASTETEIPRDETDVRFEIKGNFTAAVGSNFTVKCISSSPIVLRRRSEIDFVKEMDDYSMSEDYNEVYVLEHKLTDLTYKDVGWFDCHDKYHDNPTNVSFYLFVDDPVHLMTGPKVTRVSAQARTPVVVPCFPTAPDVDVNLLTSEGDPMVFSVDPKDEDKDKFYYHPTRGIILPSKLMTAYWYIYICEFSKRGVKQRKYIDVFLDGGHQPNYVYLEYQPNIQNQIDAEPDTNVELAAEVFTNYEPTLRWYDPENNEITTNSKYVIEHTLGEPYETRLTIYEFSSKDNGTYKVSADNSKEIHFTVNAKDASTVKIKMEKIFLVSDDNFVVFYKDTRHTLVQIQTWSFKPYNCQHEDDCEVTVSSGNADKLKKYGIEYEPWIPRVIVFNKHIPGNLTCTVTYEDGKRDSITRPLIVSEAKDGFEIEHKYGSYGGTRKINLTCTVSRFLYSENLYWIGADGFVIEKERKEDWRNITVTRSETIYSYQVTLLMEVKARHRIPVEEYKCMAVDSNHIPSFKSHVLNLKDGISATIFKSNMKNDSQLISVGETLPLNCYAGGSPIPTLHWYKDGLIIGKPGLHELKLYLKMSDTGRYSCQVENFVGSDFVYVDVEVFYPVHVSLNDTVSADGWSLKGRETERVTLQCSLGDQPVQNITWFKDHNKVFESSSIKIRNNGTLLSIFPVKTEDSGFYTCGPDNSKHKEHLVADPVHVSLNDTVSADGWSLKGRETERVTLQCSLGDQPVQNITWFKDHNKVFESSSIKIRNNGTLLSIFPVKTEDSGFYTCGPDNSKHKEHLVADSPSIFALVLGSIFAIVVVFAAIYIRMRVRRLRASKRPISYHNLLHSQT